MSRPHVFLTELGPGGFQNPLSSGSTSPSASFPTRCWLRSCLLFWTTNTSLKWITPPQNLLPNFQQIFLFSSCSLPPYPIPLCSPKSRLILNSCIHFFAGAFYLYFGIFWLFLSKHKIELLFLFRSLAQYPLHFHMLSFNAFLKYFSVHENQWGFAQGL